MGTRTSGITLLLKFALEYIIQVMYNVGCIMYSVRRFSDHPIPTGQSIKGLVK